MSLLDDIYALIQPRGASIGTVIPGIVVREVHQDETAITIHPVETGAAVSDHAFLLPARLEMLCGWSDSSVGYVGYTEEVEEALLALRATREPFTVSTGYRTYPSMLIRSLVREIDDKTSNALMLAIGLQQVIITNTQGGGGAAPNAAQADPATTGSTVDTGTNSLLPTDPSQFGGYNFSGATPGGNPSFFASPNGGIVPGNLALGISPNASLFGQFLPS